MNGGEDEGMKESRDREIYRQSRWVAKVEGYVDNMSKLNH